MFLLWHPSLTAINVSYTFPILETSATALCGTTGRFIYVHIYIDIDNIYISYACPIWLQTPVFFTGSNGSKAEVASVFRTGDVLRCFQIQKTRTVDFAKPGRIHPDQLINQPSVWLPSEIVGPAIFVLADSPGMTWSSHLKRHFQLQIMAKDLSSLCSTRMHMCVALKSLKQSAWTAAKG